MTKDEMLQLPEVQAEIERIAEQEHEQWMRWAKSLIPELEWLVQNHADSCQCITCKRLNRWEGLFIPYSMLSEESKEQDRKEARANIFSKSSKLAVVLEDQSAAYHSIKPNCPEGCQLQGRKELTDDGFRRVAYVGL